MNLLQSTLLYMLLAMILMISLHYVFKKINFHNYNAILDDRDIFFLYATITALLYLIYVVAFMETILPLIISAITLCVIWFYFLIFDIELRVMPIQDKILIILITLTMITLAFFGFEYILLLGMTKAVRVKIFDHKGMFDSKPKEINMLFLSDLEEVEIRKITDLLVGLYESEHIKTIDVLESALIHTLMYGKGELQDYSLEFNINQMGDM